MPHHNTSRARHLLPIAFESMDHGKSISAGEDEALLNASKQTLHSKSAEADLSFHLSHSGESRFRRTWQKGALIAWFLALLGTLWLQRRPFYQPLPRESQTQARNPAYLIEAEHGAVASENQRCSDIGVDVLKEGGNAVDAAISAVFCVGVVNMFS
jgi:gamma-glutamyltranspeptidase/glutathione hydrolase/leukotriene-C4 hydrolase